MELKTKEDVKQIIADGVAYLEKTRSIIVNEEMLTKLDKAINGIKTAQDVMADNKEKQAFLVYMVINWTTQITSMAFCKGTLTKELEKEFRNLPSVEDAGNLYMTFEQARQERIDAVNKEHADIMAEQKSIDIFKAIVNGMDKEEAKAKMAEYEAQLTEARKQVKE